MAAPGVRGFDASQNLVETLGLLRAVVVTAAHVRDRDGARLRLSHLPGGCKKLRKIGVDGG
jgi:putative transposase